MENIDENSLAWALKFKPKLRFDIGMIVYLKADLRRKCPMVICGFELHYDDYDYVCTWSTSQKEVKRETFLDKILTI